MAGGRAGAIMLTCQAIYGTERGSELSAFMEKATGLPCPCQQGDSCFLMPRPRASVDLVVVAPVA